MFFSLIWPILFGAAIVAIVYAVSYKITLGNLAQIVREALGSSKEERAKELLSKYLEATVDNIEGHTISLSLLESLDKEPVKLTITGTEVDAGFTEGMKIPIEQY